MATLEKDHTWIDLMGNNYVSMNLIPFSVVVKKYELEGREGSLEAFARHHNNLYDDSPFAVECDEGEGLESFTIDATDIPEFVNQFKLLGE